MSDVSDAGGEEEDGEWATSLTRDRQLQGETDICTRNKEAEVDQGMRGTTFGFEGEASQ